MEAAERAAAGARLASARAEAAAAVAELDRRIADITAARANDNSDDEHDPEGATLAFERSQAGALRTAALRRLDDVEAAGRRLAAGVYGVCAVCGAAIPAARLEARPTADRCVRHAS